MNALSERQQKTLSAIGLDWQSAPPQTNSCSLRSLNARGLIEVRTAPGVASWLSIQMPWHSSAYQWRRVPSAPGRIQLRRTRGWRKPANTVTVARPGPWGNPWRVGMSDGYTAADAVRDYRRWIERDPAVRNAESAFGAPPTVERIRTELRGRNLACWCPPGSPCHADVLLEIANTSP